MADLEGQDLTKKETWDQMWQTGDLPWHQDKPDPFLDQHEEEIFGGQKKRVFVPLCGKSIDMIWFYERGHTVLGVEIVEKAVQDFFTENKMEAETEDIAGVGKVYKNMDGKIQIYVADLYSLTADLLGPVDLIWDTGSITAINSADNQRYVALLTTFMKEGGLWYAFSFEYDPSVWPGPPQSLSDEDITTLFGTRYTIQTISEEKHEGLDSGRFKKEETPSDAALSARIMANIQRSSYMNHRRYRFMLK